MSRYIDLTGQRFGRLVVKERAPNHGREGTFWLCQCDCGKTAIVAGSKLRSGHTQSCGCLQRERTSKANKKFNTFRTVGGIVYVKMSNTEKEMLVDSDIWEKLKNYCWYENTLGYAASKDYGAKSVFYSMSQLFQIALADWFEIILMGTSLITNGKTFALFLKRKTVKIRFVKKQLQAAAMVFHSIPIRKNGILI